jgi:thermitase
LIISVNPNLSGDQVQTILKQSADDLGPAGWDPRYGWGRVNARKAVELAAASVPDLLAPTVTIKNPDADSTVSGSVSVAVVAADDHAVAKVEWYLDGALMETSSKQNPVFAWDTSEVANGLHALQARAYDLAGNIGSSTPISVTVANTVGDSIPPVVRIESPSYGDGFGPLERVSVKASDNIGVARLELYVDGRLLSETAQAGAVFKWQPKPMDRPHTLQAVAYDAAGNIGTSRPVVVFPTVSVPQFMRD